MSELATAQAARFEALDPWLPTDTLPPSGELITASLADGRPVEGIVYRAVHDLDSVAGLWEPRVVWELTPLIGDTGRAGMDAVLGAFRSWLTGEVPAGAQGASDTGARLWWPSRDIAVAPALHAHGMVPMTVLAVRNLDACTTPAAAEVTVRRATAADLEELVELELAELDYSAQVTGATHRDNAPALLTGPVERALRFGGRFLLAESRGVAVGMASCGWASPVSGSSIEGMLPEGRWGYVGTLSVAPAARGTGVGRALMAQAHQELLTEGVRGTYVYYDIANPLSSVFWPRQGYRPLWTKWMARPISSLR